jgi:FdhD protein
MTMPAWPVCWIGRAASTSNRSWNNERKNSLAQQEKKIEIIRQTSGRAERLDDWVAMEEPLEIRIVFGPNASRKTRNLAVTMRTPGNDFELATGFLVSEGIVSCSDHIIRQRFSGPIPVGQERSNTVELELSPSVEFELRKLRRHFYTTSSCGVCGKASLDAIKSDSIVPIVSDIKVSASLIQELPDILLGQQGVFARTGGLHAAGLATATGQLIELHEDVGRHNAVDKLIGAQLLAGSFPLVDRVLLLSGRASFELMQKALLASIPVVIAVGAPSSLAVELAREFDLTLIGFASRKKFNVYAGEERISD